MVGKAAEGRRSPRRWRELGRLPTTPNILIIARPFKAGSIAAQKEKSEGTTGNVVAVRKDLSSLTGLGNLADKTHG
jgi:hypothetical protein